jgi:hypothetical protein
LKLQSKKKKDAILEMKRQYEAMIHGCKENRKVYKEDEDCFQQTASDSDKKKSNNLTMKNLIMIILTTHMKNKKLTASKLIILGF